MHDAVDSESGDGPKTPVLTPEQKLGFNKGGGHRVESASSHGASSDHSLKEGSESSSSLSDSDSDSFSSSGNAYFSLPMNTDHNGFHKKIVDLGSDLPSMEGRLQMHAQDDANSGLKADANGDYEELLGRVGLYEEELRACKLKLKVSEDEVARLKGELGKSECLVALVGTLQAQFESAQVDIKTKAADLEKEKKRVLDLQTEITEYAQDFQDRLNLAHEEINRLTHEVDSQDRHIFGLEERIALYEKDLSDRDDEIRRLNAALLDAQEAFSREEANLQSDLFALTEKRDMLEARLNDWELLGQSLENKVRQCEAEKMESERLHDVQVTELEGEIGKLKLELIERCGNVEALNKDFDCLMHKYDMLMADKDGMSAKVNTLVAEVSSKENEMRQLEGRLEQLHAEHAELIAGSESAHKRVDELRMRVVELEKEVDRQGLEISAVAEGKRAAIKQLCFSLEHYRSGYKELRQAFIGHRRPSVMAS